jgi:Cytochrome P460
VNMQVIVTDSKKYAATGGWGFGDFRDGKPSDEALHKKFFSCHEPVKDHDFVFTRYAP